MVKGKYGGSGKITGTKMRSLKGTYEEPRKVVKKKGALNIISSADNEKAIMGRPKIEFDLPEVEKLGEIWCTHAECAAVLNVSTRTLSDSPEFLLALEKGQERGKKSLRRAMFDMAMSGNAAMAIFLSKQWLGYRDKQPDEVSHVVFNVQINQVPK